MCCVQREVTVRTAGARLVMTGEMLTHPGSKVAAEGMQGCNKL